MMDMVIKTGSIACGAFAAALAFVVLLYFNDHTSSLLIGKLSLWALLAYVAALLWLIVRFAIRMVRRNIADAGAALLAIAILASPPLWGGFASAAIDRIRFHSNERFYESAVLERAVGDAKGFVEFDWGSSGSAIGPSRMHSLVHTDNVDWRMPATPEGCQSTVTHLSGKFYSLRILCG